MLSALVPPGSRSTLTPVGAVRFDKDLFTPFGETADHEAPSK
jgi:hypothetical protein